MELPMLQRTDMGKLMPTEIKMLVDDKPYLVVKGEIHSASEAAKVINAIRDTANAIFDEDVVFLDEHNALELPRLKKSAA